MRESPVLAAPEFVFFGSVLLFEVKNSLSFDEYARALPSSTLVMNVRLFRDLGVVSLAVILIGLIVTWAGYIKGVRWTWFVMFVIVWVWAFPVLLLPYLQLWRNVVAITEWLPDAIKQSGPSRDFVEVVLIFVLMVLALVLPVKTLFLGAKGWLPSDRTKLTTDD